MRTLLALIAWLATRAGADLSGARASIRLAETTGADRAGRLVEVPQETLEPEVSRQLGGHWALWVAVGLILLILAGGFMGRKWKAHRGARVGRFPWPVWGRGSARK